ncbi:2Fe-2S iron-sulfur cluster-binding protein [Proteiniborus sp. MB09-C3]|uniref:(2Fe-2S)-binding protein n=1 Tax=Proteiniborus sp. MB09-C3 TaxID=3050072 RepID=UPI0025522945|nr:2Fe-2S iron-sulfur cluster-binding protein [Proteiniborus sp. MB09-C3]WIV12377.1 2Fe-2S iron-sulfur cluster-binding protein [Proteiniborus sp. MB09-C3]
MNIKININGANKIFDIEPHEYLIDVLRKNGYLSVKRGCDTGACGVCTVLIDGAPTLSCSFLAARAHERSILTIEGVQEQAKEVGGYLVVEGVDQCGYCSPGLILTTIAMKSQLEAPTEESIKHFLAGNLCRCTGYVGQLRAIKKYMGVE